MRKSFLLFSLFFLSCCSLSGETQVGFFYERTTRVFSEIVVEAPLQFRFRAAMDDTLFSDTIYVYYEGYDLGYPIAETLWVDTCLADCERAHLYDPSSNNSYWSKIRVSVEVRVDSLDLFSPPNVYSLSYNPLFSLRYLLVPGLDSTQIVNLSGRNGMIIYNTTNNQFNFYENGAWVTK